MKMTREELVMMARREQSHTALEEATAPLEILPNDLLTLLVDSQDNPNYRIEGFVMRLSNEYSYFLDGKEVEVDLFSSMCSGGRFWVLCNGQRVPAGKIEVRTREFPVWVAVIRGNGVILERELRERGFPNASNGHPAYCRVREATEEEKEAYLKA
jgi:hypothetical protein